ncbi:MAG: FHA domain-containing protein [Olegusella sp.]|nr:FHA domain-containing protein [Olegusella sp.]
MKDRYVFGSREREVEAGAEVLAASRFVAEQLATKRLAEGHLETGEPVTEQLATKTCPRCGQVLFADMDVCYGCLYDFRRHAEGTAETDTVLPNLEEKLLPDDLMPDEPSEPPSRVALWIRTGDIDASVPLPERGLSVGREPSCDIVLHSQAVSRRHILVTPDPNGACFRDLGSTNQALYQGRPIEGSAIVPFDAPVILCGTYLVPRRAF